MACTSDAATDTRSTDKTIGYYCDLLLPSFCTYAVEQCGAAGTVADCVTNARPSCCQGACQRAARPVCATDPCPEGGEDEVISACLVAYTGSATPLASGSAGSGGASGAGGGAAPSGQAGAANGLSCPSVLVGFAPVACQEKFLLLDAPWSFGSGGGAP